MQKNQVETSNFKRIDEKIQARLHSINFRKIVLLFLVATALIFDLAILSYQNKIAKEKIEPTIISRRKPNSWEKDVKNLLAGSKMEIMTPYIAQKDKQTAAFLVGIAKKESNWGKYSPLLDGKNCYNYWGYRAKSKNVTPSGYTCFESPREAVNVVSKRMSQLINESNLNTPRKMAVWKCGWDCSWDNSVAVDKWVSDVDYYYQKFYE